MTNKGRGNGACSPSIVYLFLSKHLYGQESTPHLFCLYTHPPPPPKIICKDGKQSSSILSLSHLYCSLTHGSSTLIESTPPQKNEAYSLICKISSNQIWIDCHFQQPLTYSILTILISNFLQLPNIISYKGSFHSYKTEL